MRQLPPEGFPGHHESEPCAVPDSRRLASSATARLRGTGATFDHSTTGFPLTGAHTSVQCAQCHVNGNYNLTSANTACVSCHLKDFQGATNPNHVQSGFAQTCQQCHTTTSWMGANFDHATTGFPLTGAHTSVQCAQCHVNGNYNLTSANTACVSCHLKDFQGTTNPNHVSSGFPQTCQQCHSTSTWTERNLRSLRRRASR